MIGKYKVWCINKKEWESDFVVLSQNGTLLHYIYLDRPPVVLKPDTYVVVFFTGLLDKNGKEIYEGDVVEVTDAPYDTVVLTVVYGGAYNYASFGLTGGRAEGHFGADPTWDVLTDELARSCTVIGNIYENPELVGESHLSSE